MQKNNDIIKIPVYMLDEDAKRFIEFQEHYDLFKVLIDRKVCEQRGASITLHFDNLGVLGGITRSDVLYSINSKFDNTNPKVV